MLAYVGGYTSADRNGRAKGITVFRTAAGVAAWTPLQILATLDNPSLLRIGPDGRMLYAVHGARTRLSAYAIDPATGLLDPRGDEDSGGTNPVDLGIALGGSILVTANYTSGTVAVLPIAADGTLRPAHQTIALARPGTAAQSWPHGVTFNVSGDVSGRFVLIPDKGLDCVFVFRIEPDGHLVPGDPPFAACADGSGPRHAAFNPVLPVLYVVNELSCSVQVFRWNDGRLDAVQEAPTLPAGTQGESFAAEVAVSPDGNTVYASIRGHDSIAHFAVDPRTGLLGPAYLTPSGGREPRLFALSPDGRVLHVANQESDVIISFPLDEKGKLGPGSEAARVGSPTAICFGTAR